MNLPIKFAQRYLFAKRSTNAINIISGITVFGLSIGTAALVLVLSVFNGLENLITGMVNSFNPDVKVAPVKGKVFVLEHDKMLQIKNLKGVEYISETIEEIAFFQYKKEQNVGMLKGVDANFHKVTNIGSTLLKGKYLPETGDVNFAILGRGILNKLGVSIDDQFNDLKIFMAKRENVGPMSKQFRDAYAIPSGVFSIQPEYDQKYVLSSLDFARQLLNYEKEVSYLEIKLNPATDASTTIQQIRQILGKDFTVKDRYQQDEAFNKVMNIEKWISFAILSLTLLLVAFNLVGTLWMLVLDKKKDISVLKSMGATDSLVRNIFLNEGMLISLVGMVLGFSLALFLYFLQKQFCLIPSPGFIIECYPIELRWTDFLVVAVTVIFVGFIASITPSLKAASIPAIVREE